MDTLRRLPPINDVLNSGDLAPFHPFFGQPFFRGIVDQVVGEVRTRLAQSPSGATREQLTAEIAAEVARRLKATMQPSLKRVINASGVVLHTNLGRAPLPAIAVDHMKDIATRYSNLEFDIEQGERGKRDIHAELLLCCLLGAEAAIVVNNNAAAVLLVLNTFGEGGDIIASRGEQVEIGGSFRIPEVMAKSGARLREVGTTNRTRIGDYASAICAETRLLLRVHPSNFRITGFTERPSLDQFAALGKERNVPTFEDLGSGCLVSLASIGISSEPVVADSLRAGVDVVCFSGDKLVGGPQAGIIAGKKAFIGRIRRNPLFRALRVDKLAIGALESILLLYLRNEASEIPVWAMLHASEAELQRRAKSLAAKLPEKMEVVRLTSLVGGGSAPEAPLPSWGIALKSETMSAGDLEKRLRQADPAIIARIDEGRVVLDLRTIFREDEEELLERITQILSA